MLFKFIAEWMRKLYFICIRNLCSGRNVNAFGTFLNVCRDFINAVVEDVTLDLWKRTLVCSLTGKSVVKHDYVLGRR